MDVSKIRGPYEYWVLSRDTSPVVSETTSHEPKNRRRARSHGF